MTSQPVTPSQQSNGCERITSQILYRQCPHGLIENFPVPVTTLSTKWNRGNVYNKPIEKSKWRATSIYNVICQHSDCVRNQSWCERINYRSFKTGHWNRKHNKQNKMKLKVVSYWKTEQNENGIKCTKEYRLVTTDTLEYIDPNTPIERDDIQMHILDTDAGGVRDVADITSISNQVENTNVHRYNYGGNVNRSALDTDDGWRLSDASDDDYVHSTNILDTSGRHCDSDQEDIDVSTNTNTNSRKRKLEEPSNPDFKRQRYSGDDMVMLPRGVLQQITDMVREMKQVAIDLRVVEKGLKDTQIKLQETNVHFDEMKSAFEQHQNNKESTDCMSVDESLLMNEMDINRRNIQSVNLQQFVANEGQNVWSLEEMKDGNGDFVLQCKLCNSCTDILNDNKEETKDDAPNIQAIDRRQKRSFGAGQIISSEQRINAQFFNQKYKTMKKHTKTNKKHVAALTVFNENMTACSSNIRVKSEVAFQLFTRSEPDVLFHKIMTLLHRYNL